MHVIALKAPEMTIYLFWTAKISFLQVNKAFTKIFFEYLDYANVFLVNLAIKLPKDNNINDYFMELIKGKQLLYRPIYSLGPVE